MVMFNPRMFFQRDINCTETKGPRFRVDMSWWVLRIVLSVLSLVASLSS